MLFCAAVLLISRGYRISLPLIAIALGGIGAAMRLIGLWAALPALGWLARRPRIPLALRRRAPTRPGLALLPLALAAWGAMAFPAEPWLCAGTWFLFGGALGLIHRLIACWLPLPVPETRRGHEIGAGKATFSGGILLGSALRARLGIGLAGFGCVAMLIASVGAVLLRCNLRPAPQVHLSWRRRDLALLAERFRGEDLLRANLACGAAHAPGARIGPLLAAGLIVPGLIARTLKLWRRP